MSSSPYVFNPDLGDGDIKNPAPPSPTANTAPPIHGQSDRPKDKIRLETPVFDLKRAVNNMKFTLDNFCKKMGNLEKCCDRLFYGLCMLLDIQINGKRTNVNISNKMKYERQEYGEILPSLRTVAQYTDDRSLLRQPSIRPQAMASSPQPRGTLVSDRDEAAGDIGRFLICYMEWKKLDKGELGENFAIKDFLKKTDEESIKGEWNVLADEPAKRKHMHGLYVAVFATHTFYFKGLRDTINDALNTKQAKYQAIMSGVATLATLEDKSNSSYPFIDWWDGLEKEMKKQDANIGEILEYATYANFKNEYEEGHHEYTLNINDEEELSQIFRGLTETNFESSKKRIIEHLLKKISDKVKTESFVYNTNLFFKNEGIKPKGAGDDWEPQCIKIRNKFYTDRNKEMLNKLSLKSDMCRECHKTKEAIMDCEACKELLKLYDKYKSIEEAHMMEILKQKNKWDDYQRYKDVLQNFETIIDKAILISEAARTKKASIITDDHKKGFALEISGFDEAKIQEMEAYGEHFDEQKKDQLIHNELELYESFKGFILDEDDDNSKISVPGIDTINVENHEGLKDVCDWLTTKSDEERIQIRKHYSWVTSVKMPILSDGGLHKNEYEHVFPVLFLFLFVGGYVHMPSAEGHELWKEKFAEWNRDLSIREYEATGDNKKKIQHTLRRLGYSNLFPFTKYNYDAIEWMFKNDKNKMLDFIIDTISLFDESVLLCESDANQLKSDAIFIKCVVPQEEGQVGDMWSPSNRSIIEYLMPVQRMIHSIDYHRALKTYNIAKALRERVRGGTSGKNQYSHTMENVGALSLSLINCAKPKQIDIDLDDGISATLIFRGKGGVGGVELYEHNISFDVDAPTDTTSVQDTDVVVTYENFFEESNERVRKLSNAGKDLFYKPFNEVEFFKNNAYFILKENDSFELSFGIDTYHIYKISKVTLRGRKITITYNIVLPLFIKQHTGVGGKKKRSKKKRTKKKRRRKKKTRGKR